MAERSFAKEVQLLKKRAGEEFIGEGILAVTKALLQCGVGYVGGYQGAPISHLMDVLADARETLDELGVHFEVGASEASAAAMLSTSMHFPIRGAVTWKSTVGTNVASDALANLSSGGVTGGALVIVGEDYGEGSSIMQERSHAFAMKSQIWMLDPRPNLPSIVKAVEDGFNLSEASNTPVMLQLRIRTCHVHGSFIAKDNKRPTYSLEQARNNPQKDASRIILPPMAFDQEQDKVQRRWPAAVDYIKTNKLNEFFNGDMTDIGIILQGGMYNGVITALRQLGLADIYGNTRVPLYCLNVTYPLVDDEVVAFCDGKSKVLMVEEGQPEHLEQAIHTILRRAGVTAPLYGKGDLPMAGEYTGQVLRDGIAAFMARGGKPTKPKPPILTDILSQDLNNAVPPRPPGFCTGCPERPIFSALTLAQEELGERHITCDIGCHLFSTLPPFNIGAGTMGYGLGAASASAMNVDAGQRTISIMGDGGFWHNGLTSGIGNAVFNRNDNVILIVDNYYAAATGGQDILSSRAKNAQRSTSHPIEDAVRGVGVKWVRRVDDTYNVGILTDVLKEALSTPERGPKVVIAASECMLNKQRREKPLKRAALAAGTRSVVQRFGVDSDICTGDHACMRISGCPSLTMKTLDDPLVDDPVAFVDESCVACGHCGEVADAAVLCPSFYRADVVHNPNTVDRLLNATRRRFLTALQNRRAGKQLMEQR